MNPRKLLLLFVLMAAIAAQGQDTGGELAKIKEQELEEVRERISTLKKSMDESAAARDRVTIDLQAAEIDIAEKRVRLKELERERDFSARRKAELDAQVAKREAELDEESGELADQVRAAYMTGNQERVKLLLNQRDPATLGRLMAYYGYLNDYRGANIEAVTAAIRELAELRSQVAAEEARIADLARARYAELTRLNEAQDRRQTLLVNLKDKISDEGQEVARLAAQEKDLSRLIAELTSILSDYPITSEDPFSEHKGRLTWPVAGTLLHDFGQPRVSDRLKYVKDPTTLFERFQVANTCITDLKVSIPCLIDDMKNTAARAYKAWPDRLFIVGRYGRLAYTGESGPFGFLPHEMEKALKKELKRKLRRF